MSKQQFSSGKEAIDWLLRGEAPAKGKGAKLEAEIAESIAGSGKSPRKAASSSAPRAARVSKPKAGRTRGSMSASEFYSSLPASIDMEGSRSVSLPEVAKRIREEIAGAVDAGALPEGTKVSVTKDHNSIRVEVTRWSAPVFSKGYEEHLMDPRVDFNERGGGGGSRHGYHNDPRLSKELNDGLALIQRISQRHNYDKSDSMSDYFNVGYYLSVSADEVKRAAEQGIKQEHDKGFGELLRQGQEAAKAVGPACTKAVCRSKDLRSAGEHCLKELIAIAKRAEGRPVEYDGSRRGWFPVDEKAASREKLKLDHTVYTVAYKSADSYTLMGPRGGMVHLVRNVKQPDYWGVSKDRGTTWYRKNADGTFTRTS